MDKILFEDLLGSLKEPRAISKGKAAQTSRFVIAAPEMALESLHA